MGNGGPHKKLRRIVQSIKLTVMIEFIIQHTTQCNKMKSSNAPPQIKIRLTVQ